MVFPTANIFSSIHLIFWIYPTLQLLAGSIIESFFSRAQLAWIHSFPSPKLVALTILKNPVCLTIYLTFGHCFLLLSVLP